MFEIHARNTNGRQGPIGIQDIFFHLGISFIFCPGLDREVLAEQLFNMNKGIVAILEVRFRLAAYKATLSIGDNEPGTTQLSIPKCGRVDFV
jgi:hypothetical protein